MPVAFKLGLTRQPCVYNVHLVKKYENVIKWKNSPKKRIWKN